MEQTPILWSFRRCPYAMRARLAIARAGRRVELREILLKDKPAAFLATSPSATVPALRLPGRVLDESLDIMRWALDDAAPDVLLKMPQSGWDLIAENDGRFKAALDRTKYANRYPECDPLAERANASTFLHGLDARLSNQSWLFGARASFADLAILPFVRQFAYIDRTWFDAQPWSHLRAWLDRFLESPAFTAIMYKYPPWRENDEAVFFGHAP